DRERGAHASHVHPTSASALESVAVDHYVKHRPGVKGAALLDHLGLRGEAPPVDLHRHLWSDSTRRRYARDPEGSVIAGSVQSGDNGLPRRLLAVVKVSTAQQQARGKGGETRGEAFEAAGARGRPAEFSGGEEPGEGHEENLRNAAQGFGPQGCLHPCDLVVPQLRNELRGFPSVVAGEIAVARARPVESDREFGVVLLIEVGAVAAR